MLPFSVIATTGIAGHDFVKSRGDIIIVFKGALLGENANKIKSNVKHSIYMTTST